MPKKTNFAWLTMSLTITLVAWWCFQFLPLPVVASQMSSPSGPVMEGGAYQIFLPIVMRPLVVNTTEDAVDVNPGDGICEIAVGTGICSLRAAIQETNASPTLNNIVLPAGVYVLTRVGDSEDLAATGDLDITDNLTLSGAGPSATVVNGNRLDRVFHSLGVPVTISGISITNGVAKGFWGGGGIYNGLNPDLYAAPLTLDNVVVSHNISSQPRNICTCEGGGIMSVGPITITASLITDNEVTFSHGGGLAGEAVVIENSTIRNNRAGLYGGGIWAGSLTIDESIVESNSFIESGQGAGIYVMYRLTMEDSTVRNNVGGAGGGLFLSMNANVTINQSVISGNTDGGIFNESHQSVVVTDSQIMNNHAFTGAGINFSPVFLGGQMRILRTTIAHNIANDRGGGIYNNGYMSLENVTMTGNQASGFLTQLGGAIVNGNGTLAILNSTIFGNRANYAGGIVGEYQPISVKNSIVAGNTALLDSSTHNCAVLVVSHGNNIENAATCPFTAVGDRRNTNPLLGPLQFNGGNTPTQALLAGSPAIDAGNNAGCPASDQRAALRPVDGNGDGTAVCDIGAYEYP
jgi:CSLREA domain-containing protein